MPRTAIVQKTAVFKLHNPSATKRGILDAVFARYGEAYNRLLECCRKVAEEWLEATRAGERLLSLHRAEQRIRPLCPSAADLALPGSLRDGLIQDAAGNLLSYCRLALDLQSEKRRQTVARPPGYPAPLYGYRPDAYYATLAEAVSWTGDALEFTDFQSRLSREARDVVRPLSFRRTRDFALERLENGRWGVTVHLQPRGMTPTAVRFPLAFGEWHEAEYLTKGIPRCARLCRREREYFLHVSFEFPVEVMARGEEQAYLGLDRGITKQAAYALVDLKGRVRHVGHLGRELRNLQVGLGRYRQAEQKAGRRVRSLDWQRRHQEELLHQVANALVQVAAESRALLVIEDLSLHTAGRYVRSQYAKLEKILGYKLTQAGLLPPKKVFAALSSKLCSRCGQEGLRGDPDREHFQCPSCGAALDADENAAVNIARRALYRRADWERQGGYRAFHRSFGSVE